MNLKKIISEEIGYDNFDWTKEIKGHLPTADQIRNFKVKVEIPLEDYMVDRYDMRFFNLVLEDGRIVELIVDDGTLTVDVFDSFEDMKENAQYVINGDTLEENLEYYRAVEATNSGELIEKLKQIIPYDFKTYVGDL